MLSRPAQQDLGPQEGSSNTAQQRLSIQSAGILRSRILPLQLWPLDQNCISSSATVQYLGRQGQRADSGNALYVDDPTSVE